MGNTLADCRSAPVLLALFCLLLYLPGTWSLPLLDRDEPRFAEASREMRQRGDYVVPFFNNEPRFDKPPLIYWMQAASFAVFGESEFAARLPSVAATALTALLVSGFASRLYGRRAGWTAAVAFALCLQVSVQGRAGTADLCMVMFVTLASWAACELVMPLPPDRRSPRFWWWTFYAALALGFLAKGPVAWLPIGTVLLFSFCQGQVSASRAMRFHFGLPVTIVLIAIWGVPALIRTDFEYLHVGIGKHVIGRSLIAMEGHGAHKLAGYVALLPFYFVTVFASFAPWSLFLPGMLAHFKKQAHRGTAEVFLISGIIVTFGIFTPLSTKLPHYTLPALPLLSILFAGWLRDQRLPFGLVVGMTALQLSAGLIFAPLCAHFFPVRRLAQESTPWLKPDTELGSVDFQEPSLVWYFREHIGGWPRAIRADEVVQFMSNPGSRACVLPAAVAEKLAPTAPPRKQWDASGINIANGRRVSLVLWVKDESR